MHRFNVDRQTPGPTIVPDVDPTNGRSKTLGCALMLKGINTWQRGEGRLRSESFSCFMDIEVGGSASEMPKGRKVFTDQLSHI